MTDASSDDRRPAGAGRFDAPSGDRGPARERDYGRSESGSSRGGDYGGDDRGRRDGPPRRDSGGYRSRSDRSRRRRFPRRKVCPMCVEKVEYIDYKDVDRLRRFLTERSKIRPGRMTGVCAPHQRQLTAAIKRARVLALLRFKS